MTTNIERLHEISQGLPDLNGNGQAPHRAESWVPKDLTVRAANPPAPPDLVLTPQGEGILYRGLTHMVSGEPESMKSWVGLIAAKEEIDRGRNVIWIDTDGAGEADTYDRLQGLGVTPAQVSAQFAYIEPEEAVTREQLIELNDEWQPALVVIDALNPAMVLLGLDPMSETDVEKFRRIALGCWGDATEILVDHVSKDKERRAGYSIGSQRKQALVKVHIQLETVDKLSRDTAGLSRVLATKDRPGWHHRGQGGRIGELTITPDGRGGLAHSMNLTRITGREKFRPTSLMEQVSRAVNTHGAPMSKQEIKEKVKGRAEFLFRAVDLLVDEGFIERRIGSRGAHLHTFLKPYFEDADPKRNAPLPTYSHPFPEDVL